jgi:hypothetical protein
MYTAQVNAHGNVIICKGEVERNSYRIVFRGSYQDCLLFKMKRI